MNPVNRYRKITCGHTTVVFALLSSLLIGYSSLGAQTADSSRQLIVEKIEITGNKRTKPEIILRRLNFAAGDPLTPHLLETNYQRLDQTNFFKQVDFFTRPGSEKGQVIVVIEVKERRGPYLQFEGGHSDLNGWYFVPLSLRFNNVFGGDNSLGLRAYLGDRMSKLALNYRTDNLFDGQAYLEAEAFGGSHQFIHYLDSLELEQKVNFGGLHVRLGGNEGFFRYVFFGFRSENYEPAREAKFTDNDSVLTAADFPPILAADLVKRKIAAFSLGLHADWRDNPVYPLRGLWGAASAELAHREVGSEVTFRTYRVDMRVYQKLFGHHVLALNLTGAYTSSGAPFYQRFYLGGANSLRGYAERRLTPLGWGTKLFLSNVELRFPLSRYNFPYYKASAVLFFDSGGIWQTQQLDLGDLYTSVGFGFRFKLPIVGITRFDFAFPLDKVDGNDFKLQVSLGQKF